VGGDVNAVAPAEFFVRALIVRLKSQYLSIGLRILSKYQVRKIVTYRNSVKNYVGTCCAIVQLFRNNFEFNSDLMFNFAD
jgi:hypothetical protein